MLCIYMYNKVNIFHDLDMFGIFIWTPLFSLERLLVSPAWNTFFIGIELPVVFQFH
jgi:hypothetical protein